MRKFMRTGYAWLAMTATLGILGGLGCSDDDDNPTTPGHELITLELVSGRDSVANHWPGPDGLIATADDSVSASLSTLSQSEPNSIKSYSYNAFDFGTHATDTGLLPDSMNAVTFIEGTVIVDHTVLDEGGGAILADFDVSGTQPAPGHGAYTASITSVNSGTYDTSTHAFTIDVNFQANLTGGSATVTNLVLAGTAWIIHAPDFGDATGNAYLDSVLIPLGVEMGAHSVFFAEGGGVVPAASGVVFGPFPIRAALVAISMTD